MHSAANAGIQLIIAQKTLIVNYFQVTGICSQLAAYGS